MKTLGCLFALALSGCLTVKGAYVTLTGAETAVAQARAQWPALDKAHRAEIVAKAKSETAGVADLAKWDVTSDALTKAIEGTHESVKLVKPLIADVANGVRNKADLAAYIGPILEAALKLPKLLAAAGVAVK